MTKRIKDKINLKSTLCKSKKFIELQNPSTEISDMISIRKEYYFHLSKKLNNPSTRSRTSWSVLKSFYKGNNIPVIPPLLVNLVKLYQISQRKLTFSMFFFSSQCTPTSNNSALPSSKYFITDKRLTTIKFNKDDILKIIRDLNVN